MASVGFVGLGVMGGPMAGHLLSAGHDVTVWNRTASKTGAIAASGARVAPALAGLASGPEIVFLCVRGNEDVHACLAEMLPSAAAGTLFVDHSTTSPGAARSAADFCKKGGCRFMDAPVTGGSMGAQKGTLTVFCGGAEPDFQQAEPVMRAYAARAELVGGVGDGQTMKLANQIAVGGALLGLCESLAFAECAGLDLAQTHGLLSTGAAGSWAFDNYGPKVIAKDWTPGFTVSNQRKDFAYAMEAAADLGANVPGTELVDGLLERLSQQGGDGLTTAALFELLASGRPPR